MNPHLDFLLSVVYDHDPLTPLHRADLDKSGLTDETVARQKIRSVPPDMIAPLLGFDIPAVQSTMLIPFPAPAGGFMDHVRMKVFPSFTDRRGSTVKYLQPHRSGVHLYFPLVTLDRALHADEPLYLVEGEKKSLAVAQLGHAAIGFCGIEGWHLAGSSALLPDFDDVGLAGRIVDLIPDSDWQSNPHVHRAVMRFSDALTARGARARVVVLPTTLPGPRPA